MLDHLGDRGMGTARLSRIATSGRLGKRTGTPRSCKKPRLKAIQLHYDWMYQTINAHLRPYFLPLNPTYT